MKINLLDEGGAFTPYSLSGKTVQHAPLGPSSARIALSAAHVVADPLTANDPSGPATIDWHATLAFRHHLAGLGLGIAEAMDTAQRGMGLNWSGALELIRQTQTELPDALIFNGAGTDHLDLSSCASLDDVKRAYLEQVEAIQALGGRLIIMASRALAQIATCPQDYADVYGAVLSNCDAPVILHWLGEMFDPVLEGYWGSQDVDEAMQTCLAIIQDNAAKVDGIKISLLDKDKEIIMRRKLPDGIKMYTGDDFNYPELIQGDEQGFSHALLGIFDPIATAAATSISQLSAGDTDGFRATLDPTVPLARHIFRAPTQYYKTGVVFLAWLNGFQDHFIMLNGAQSMRPLPYFCETFKLADACGLLAKPDLAVHRMKQLLGLYGA